MILYVVTLEKEMGKFWKQKQASTLEIIKVFGSIRLVKDKDCAFQTVHGKSNYYLLHFQAQNIFHDWINDNKVSFSDINVGMLLTRIWKIMSFLCRRSTTPLKNEDAYFKFIRSTG